MKTEYRIVKYLSHYQMFNNSVGGDYQYKIECRKRFLGLWLPWYETAVSSCDSLAEAEKKAVLYADACNSKPRIVKQLGILPVERDIEHDS